jgi:hypothetical protein
MPAWAKFSIMHTAVDLAPYGSRAFWHPHKHSKTNSTPKPTGASMPGSNEWERIS